MTSNLDQSLIMNKEAQLVTQPLKNISANTANTQEKVIFPESLRSVS